MSSGFKFKYDQMRENDPASPGNSDLAENTFRKESNVRNVCFITPDKKHLFLNYGYLVSCELDSDNSKMTLTFTSHVVALQGTNLDVLFFEFMEHLPRIIECELDRYNVVVDEKQSVVNNILITPSNG